MRSYNNRLQLQNLTHILNNTCHVLFPDVYMITMSKSTQIMKIGWSAMAVIMLSFMKLADGSKVISAAKQRTCIIWSVLMTAYNTQNYWVSGLCPLCGILNNRKHNVSETGSVSVFRWGKGENYSVGAVRKSVQWLRLALSKSPNRVVVSLPLPEDRNRSSSKNVVFSSI
jgi:hypothetical protein